MILFHKYSEDIRFKENRLVFLEAPSKEPAVPKGEKADKSVDQETTGDKSVEAQMKQIEEMVAAHDRGERPEQNGPRGKVTLGPEIVVTDASGTHTERVEEAEKAPGKEPKEVTELRQSLAKMAQDALDSLADDTATTSPKPTEVDTAALDKAARAQGMEVNDKPFG